MKLKAIGILFGLASIAVAPLLTNAAAQGRGRGGQAPHYDVAAEITVKGTIEAITTGPQQGVHATLKTGDATVELVLGPAWYQTQQKYDIAKGDDVDVVGAKATVGEREVVLVREIKKGSTTMTFRDAKGFPMWAGRGRGW
jgi:hypothetical protein